MEDWEKKFEELEREVDAEFKKTRTTPSGDADKSRGTAEPPPTEEENSLVEQARKTATSAVLHHAAEKSIARVGARKATFYGACGVFVAILVAKNLGVILLGGSVLAILYWWLMSADEGPDDEED